MVKIQAVTQTPSSLPSRNIQNNHPFARAIEFQRALNAAKIQKIYARPFIAALPGHSQGISCMAKCPLKIQKVLSGSHDGQVRLWDLSQRKTLIKLNFHQNSIKGLTFNEDGARFLSSSEDKNINLYDYVNMLNSDNPKPLITFHSKILISNVDHSRQGNQFATSGSAVQVWDYERSKPLRSYDWGTSTILTLKYNQSQTNIIACTGIDRSIQLYDIRSQSHLQKILMPNKSRCLAWNPQQPLNFVVGNDDSNLYTYDMRFMEKPLFIHYDFIAAVMDVDFSPTGTEFVAGSFDKTVRIFQKDSPRSRQIYHGKRMQYVNAVLYGNDSQFIVTGSEDMNLRLWKANAHRPAGVASERQQQAMQYRQALVQKYYHTKSVNKIARHRHLPKYVLNESSKRKIKREKRTRKEKNRQANNPLEFQRQKVDLKTSKVQKIYVSQS